MYSIYIHLKREPDPVYAMTVQTEEEAQTKIHTLVISARVARSLGKDGDRYLQDIWRVGYRDDDAIGILEKDYEDVEETAEEAK